MPRDAPVCALPAGRAHSVRHKGAGHVAPCCFGHTPEVYIVSQMSQAIPPPYILRNVAAAALVSERTVRRWFEGEPQHATTVLRLEIAAQSLGYEFPETEVGRPVPRFVASNPGLTVEEICEALRIPRRCATAYLRNARLRGDVQQIDSRWYPQASAPTP